MFTTSFSVSTSYTRRFSFFFFNDTATTEIYTLSLHDALPISSVAANHRAGAERPVDPGGERRQQGGRRLRSEEHTSELQSRLHLVCRLLLEKKKKKRKQQRRKRNGGTGHDRKYTLVGQLATRS